MAEIRIENGRLMVRIQGLAGFIAARSSVAIPLAHVVSAVARPEPAHGLMEHLKALTNPGTDIPGVLRVGTFHARDGLVFYAIGNGKRAVVLTLEQERYKRIVVEPPGDVAPDVYARWIEEEAARARGGRSLA